MRILIQVLFTLAMVFLGLGFADQTVTVIQGDLYDSNPNRVVQYQFTDTSLTPIWSSELDDWSELAIGDANHDNTNNMVIATQDGFSIYSENSESPITIEFPDSLITPTGIGMVKIADADNDGENEILIQQAVHSRLIIYKYSQGSYNLQSVLFQDWTYMCDVGDVDNDGWNEVISPRINGIDIRRYNNDSRDYELVYIIPSDNWNDVAIVGDADNDSMNELIAGGNYNSIRIFRFSNDTFSLVAEQSLAGFCFGLSVTDIDNDHENEIISATTGIPSTLQCFEFDGLLFSELWSYSGLPAVDIPGLELSNADSTESPIIGTYGQFGWSLLSRDEFGEYNMIHTGTAAFNLCLGDFTFANDWRPELIVSQAEIVAQDTLFKLTMLLTNSGAAIDSFRAVLSSDESNIAILNDTMSFAPIPTGGSIENSNHPFMLSFNEPVSGLISFSLDILHEDSVLQSIEFDADSPYNQFQLTDVGFVKISNNPADIVFADFNLDNNEDIFVSYFYEDIRVYYENSAQDTLFQYHTFDAPERWNYGCTITDVDHDYQPDIYEINGESTGNILFLQNRFEFTNITEGANVGYAGEGEAGVSFDYNNDGMLDLFITNGRGGGELDLLYRNNGDMTYTNTASTVGITGAYNGQGVVSGDINNDGLMDIYVTNYADSNQLWLAEAGPFGAITYSNLASEYGIGFLGEFICSGLSDLNNDDYLDLIIVGSTATQIYLNQAGNSFINISDSSDIQNSGGTDLIFLDYDHDGLQDFFLVGNFYGGDISSHQIFHNLDGVHFENETISTGVAASNEGIGLAAGGDYDNDGNIDIAILAYSFNEPGNRFYQNLGNSNNWLSVRTRGNESNSLGIGARIKLWVGGAFQMREVTGNLGNSLVQNFGLGTSTSIDSLTIDWLSGIHQTILSPTINQILQVTENSTTALAGGSVEPKNFLLLPAHPNPFNASTTLRYSLPEQSSVLLTIFDVLGRRVTTLVNHIQPPGEYYQTWDGRNQGGEPVGSGVFFARLQCGKFSKTIKLALMK